MRVRIHFSVNASGGTGVVDTINAVYKHITHIV